MKVQRPADQRGRTTHGDRTRLCTFSSGDFLEPDWLGFGALRLAMLDPVALVGPLLVAVAMASLLTAQANRWFARQPEEEDGPAVFE